MNLDNLLIHDVECYPNFFSDIFKKPGGNKLLIFYLFSGELSEQSKSKIEEYFKDYEVTITCDIYKVAKFLRNDKWYLVGYNSTSYDDALWKFILEKLLKYKLSKDQLLASIYKQSSKIIEEQDTEFKYSKILKTLDVQRISGCDRIFKSLKACGISLKHDLILDLPIKPGTIITEDQVPELLYYEYFGDILITEKLLTGIPKDQISPTIPKVAYQGLLPALELRSSLAERWNINVLNTNKSQLGGEIIKNRYSNFTGLIFDQYKDLRTPHSKVFYTDIIEPHIKFETPELQSFLLELKDVVFDIEEYAKLTTPPQREKFKIKHKLQQELTFFDSNITFAQGGIHGTYHKNTIIPTKEEMIIDIDANSYYPWIYGKYNISPAHLEDFVGFVWEIIDLRIGYKKEGNKVFANGLKLGINKLFGMFNNEHGWLYDIQAMLRVTINGQLLLLMLSERLYSQGIKPFYYNTDGITVLAEKKKEQLVYAICKQWEVDTQMSLEYQYFKNCRVSNVNNFYNVTTDGEVKMKGAYEYTGYIAKYGEFDVTSAFNMPIVAYAVHLFFSEGKDILSTLKAHPDIYDFCIGTKISKQYTNRLYVNGEFTEVLQQSLRFFISKSNRKVFKVKAKTDKELISLLKKSQRKGKANKIKNTYYISSEEKENLINIEMESGEYFHVNKAPVLFGEDREEWLSFSDIAKDRNVTLFMKYFEANDYNIDYDFYYQECQKLIEAVKNPILKPNIQQLSLF